MTHELPPINDGSRHSRLDLARHATGERTLPDADGDPYLRALEAERERVEPFDFEILRARAARMEEAEPAPPRPVTTARPRPWAAWLSGLAALAVVLVLLPDLRPPPPPVEEGLKGPPGGSGKTFGPPPGIPDPAPIEGTHLGGAMSTMPETQVGTLSYVIQRGDRQLRGTWSTRLQDGDRVGFRAFAARYDAVWLVTVDDAGTVAPLDPRAGLVATPIEPDQRVDLGVHFVVTPPVDVLVLAFFGDWTADVVRATVEERWSKGGVSALVALADAEDNVAVVKLETE